MNNIFSINTENERAVISSTFGLAIECPFGGNPDYCIFHNLREIPLEKKIEEIKKMDHYYWAEQIMKHRTCLSTKE